MSYRRLSINHAFKSAEPIFGPANDLVRMLRTRLLAIVVFLAFAFVSIALINGMLARNYQPNLGLFAKKVDYLHENHDRYNVLLVGTSMMYRSLDPVLLKRVAADNGCDVRAFNLGVSQLRLTELRYIREQLPPHMLADYDLIVLAPMATSGIKAANWPSGRIQHFSDWEGYKSSLIDLWEFPEERPKTLYYSALLTGSFLYRQLGIGRLINSLQDWPGAATDNETGDTFDGGAILDFSRDGFVALDDETDEQFKRRGEAILKNGGRFEALKNSDRDISHFQGAVGERNWRRNERSMAYFADYDVPMMMFLLPMVGRGNQDRVLAEHASANGMPLVNLNRSDLHPEFFERRYWFDYYHTNAAGAALVTEQLGERICSFMPNKGS